MPQRKQRQMRRDPTNYPRLQDEEERDKSTVSQTYISDKDASPGSASLKADSAAPPVQAESRPADKDDNRSDIEEADLGG